METAGKLLPLIDGVPHLWVKLGWEANRLKISCESTPFDVDGLVFGAINFAITSQSLEDWTIKTLVSRNRRSGATEEALRDEIAKAVPMQPAFRDIANTAKHGAYRDSQWLGGAVELVHFVGFTGTPKEYVLIYHGTSSNTHSSDVLFEQTTEQWRSYLSEAFATNR